MLRTSWVVVALLCSACPSKKSPAPPPSAPAGRPLPTEIDAKALTALLAAHRGQPVVVNVFASYCGPCKTELPDLDRLKRAHPQLFLLGIDVDEDADALRAFLPTVPAAMEVVRRHDGISPLLSALRLPSDWNDSVPPGWDKTIPLTFVYDAKGEFATGSVGQLSPEAVSQIGTLMGASKP